MATIGLGHEQRKPHCRSAGHAKDAAGTIGRHWKCSPVEQPGENIVSSFERECLPVSNHRNFLENWLQGSELNRLCLSARAYEARQRPVLVPASMVPGLELPDGADVHPVWRETSAAFYHEAAVVQMAERAWIRTRETLSTSARFQDECLRPLGHLSVLTSPKSQTDRVGDFIQFFGQLKRPQKRPLGHLIVIRRPNPRQHQRAGTLEPQCTVGFLLEEPCRLRIITTTGLLVGQKFFSITNSSTAPIVKGTSQSRHQLA